MSEINSVSSLEFCQRIMSRLVSDIYYNKQNNNDFLLNKVKSIRSLNDSGNKRLKYILSELISNSDTMLKNFKPIKSIKPAHTINKKISKFGTNTASSDDIKSIKTNNYPAVDKSKEYLIQALGINKSKKALPTKYNWVDAESSEDEKEDKNEDEKEDKNEDEKEDKNEDEKEDKNKEDKEEDKNEEDKNEEDKNEEDKNEDEKEDKEEEDKEEAIEEEVNEDL
jgi:hypothetical protein